MSTRAARPGTTSGSGRSSRLVGAAAAGMAVVIAAGFVFALNGGNESPLTVAPPVAGSTFSVIGGEANQVPAAARVPESDVSLNIEKIRLGLGAGVAGTTFSVIGGEANQVPAAARVPESDVSLNIEKIRLGLQNEGGSELTPLQGRF